MDVSFNGTDFVVSENDSSIPVCVELTGDLERNITVQIFTVPNEQQNSVGGAESAIPGDDYQPLADLLTFEEGGVMSMCRSITVFPDFVIEDQESFLVALASNDSAFNSSLSQVEVFILDSNSMW